MQRKTFDFLKAKLHKLYHILVLSEADGLVTLLVSAGMFIAVLVYLLMRVHEPFWHDALFYWELGGSFDSNGRFSFLNFDNPLRGYLFPFLLYLIQWQARTLDLDARLLFAIYSSCGFVVFSVHIVPQFLKSLFDWEISAWRMLVFSALLFYFWRGYLLYPLTDFPALGALLLAGGILVRTIKEENGPKNLVLAGIFAAASMNIRPSYQLSFVVIALLLIFGFPRTSWKRLFTRVVLFIIGCGIILFPQLLINRTHFGSGSPLVLAHYLDNSNVYAVQLFWGLKTQRYETNIGENYPSSGVAFVDPLSAKLSQLGTKRKTLLNYFDVVRRHPLDVAVSYFRHTFNGLDIFYPTPYVKNIFVDHVFFSFINYLVWFLFFSYVIRLDLVTVSYVNLLGLSSLLAPIVLAVPAVVETRFFLPAYILAYGVISYGFDYKELLTNVPGNKWRLLSLFFLCITWVMICFTLSAGTIEQLSKN